MAPPDRTRLVTADQVLATDSPYRECELWDGLAVVREPSGGPAEWVGLGVMGPLRAHVQARHLGWVFGSSQGFLLRRGPDLMLAPDGSYVAKARLPALPVRGFVPLAPDLVLEVRSPDDTWAGVLAKCRVWLAHGTRLVWAIRPEGREVVTLAPGVEPTVAGPGGSFDARDVVPGFALSVDALFATD